MFWTIWIAIAALAPAAADAAIALETRRCALGRGNAWMASEAGTLHFYASDEMSAGELRVEAGRTPWDLRVPSDGVTLPEDDYQLVYRTRSGLTYLHRLSVAYSSSDASLLVTPEGRAAGLDKATLFSTLVFPSGGLVFGCCLLGPLIGAVTGEPWYFTGTDVLMHNPNARCNKIGAATGLVVGSAVGIPVSYGPLRRAFERRGSRPIDPDAHGAELRARVIATLILTEEPAP